MKNKSKYWLSLEQWSQDKEFQQMAQKEFISSIPTEKEQETLWDRREFLQLMGASMALASLGCIRRPAEKIVPYVKRPDDVVLGDASYYSSSYYDGEEGFGTLVKTRAGRPIHIAGNELHPLNQRGVSARTHSHLLSLYDPERLKTVQHNLFNEKKTNKEVIRANYAKVDQAFATQLKKGGVAFLTGEWPSPSSKRLLNDFCNAFSCSHFVWNPLNHSAVAKAQKVCYGQEILPSYHLNKARLIVSIDCDFLGTWLYPTTFSRLYAQARQANQNMNRLVVFESLFSLTGSNADQRIRIKASQQLYVVLHLIDALIKKDFVKSHPRFRFKAHLAPWEKFDMDQVAWDRLVDELWNHRGRSLVLTGGPASQTKQEEELQIATQWLNHLLGNDGKTIDYHHPYSHWAGVNRNVAQLIEQLEKKKINTLVIHRTNPLYNYPEAERLKRAIQQANLVIYTGDREDETGEWADYILPDDHDLEKWSDWEFQKGVLSIQQPTIRPLYQTRAFESALIEWSKLVRKREPSFLRGTKTWYDYLKKNRAMSFSAWDEFLSKGVQVKKPESRGKKYPSRKFNHRALSFFPSSLKEDVSGAEYELVLYSTSGLKDGTLANVSWLQEFPDPVTKICWDNYLCISLADAREKNLKEGQVVELETRGRTLHVPVHIQPGQADGVLALAIGYGRKKAGQVANQIGVNAYTLAEISPKSDVKFSALPADIKLTGKRKSLANVQTHHSMEGRQIVVETTLKQYLKNPGGAIHRHKMFSMWSTHRYPKHKWAMAIDLNSCTGCSACVIACQSENNIPTVGKELILEGREMHWMRVDRYYKGPAEKPEAVHQPIVCMHCDNAPCETVCPVVATVHSDEGTNDMIYNRCVGTRYCSNNCPYKVRRFNWFNYEKKIKKPMDMALNPEVTVRSRGVMEKCTFCIHRVRSAQSKAKLENRELKDGEVRTACQDSCPTGAIVFGDLKNTSSQVYKMFHRQDSYALLEELNTQPGVRYQVKVRNKGESIEDSIPMKKKPHHG